MKTPFSKMIALGLLTLPVAAWAGGESGFYLGGGVGQSSMETDDVTPSGENFDGTDSAYKIIVGYNFGIIPLIDLGVEGSYVDFGKIDSTTSLGKADVEVSGFDAFGVGALTFGPFAVFAKAGMLNWESDATLAGDSASDSGSDTAYGLGARFQLLSFSVRAEYEVFDVEGLKDLSMYSVSALYTF